MHDLTPATAIVAAVVTNIRDDQLDLPTPCPDVTVAGLLHHVAGLSQVFAAAASQDRPAGADGTPSFPDGSRLGADWRARIPEHLRVLAEAWRPESAWKGFTRAGGVDLPRDVAGSVVTNELLAHGWDLAVATGQPYRTDADVVAAALEFVGPAVAAAPEGTPGLFGPPVAVPDDAPPLDRLLGLTGRDPRRRAPGTTV
jgi:uncharacterized protein (TIGR03086 family)